MRQSFRTSRRLLPKAQAVINSEKAAARGEGKAAAAAAFGEPLSGPDVNEIDQAATESAIEAARADAKKTGSMVNLFRTMIAAGK